MKLILVLKNIGIYIDHILYKNKFKNTNKKLEFGNDIKFKKTDKLAKDNSLLEEIDDFKDILDEKRKLSKLREKVKPSLGYTKFEVKFNKKGNHTLVKKKVSKYPAKETIPFVKIFDSQK